MKLVSGALLSCLVASGQAPSLKRLPPPKVRPVTAAGVTFRAPNDDGRRGYVVATEATTGRRLWELTIFTVAEDPALEADVQWTYIVRLGVRGQTLTVVDEEDRVFRVDLKTRNVLVSK